MDNSYNAITRSIPDYLKERHTYVPSIETARKAPAAVCAIASRIVRLRAAFKKLQETGKESLTIREVESLLTEVVSPIPFEAEFLSGDIAKVDIAITQIW